MTSESRWRLAPGVHAAVESGNLVLLDEGRDAYFCLPGAGADLLPGPVGRELGQLPRPVLEELDAAGLARQGPGAPPEGPVVIRPAADLAGLAPGPVRLADGAALALAYLTLAPSFHRRPFAQVLAHARRRRARRGSGAGMSEALARRAALFNALLPWSPIQGACLLQAALLLQYLDRSGLTADWVFGVRTWPFSAHCWVQAGDTVLNDTVERVAPYRAILKV